jgi:GTP cyclohydrolase II
MQTVKKIATSRMPTSHGDFTLHIYRSANDPQGLQDQVALVAGELKPGQEEVLVRLHSECLTGDVLGSRRCDCGEQLAKSQETIAQAGCGVILYLRGHEGRGIGLAHKIKAYALQDQGRDTVQANLEQGLPIDARSYDLAAAMLRDLGLQRIQLLTNNPEKVTRLQAAGISVSRRVPLLIAPNQNNAEYLQTKRTKLGHYL